MTTTPTDSQVRRFAGLMTGLFPVWVQQAVVDGSNGSFALQPPPYQVGDGVSVAGAVYALVRIHMRDDARVQRFVFTVAEVDDAATYTVTLDGDDYPYVASGGDGVEEILAGLAAAIGAPAFDASATATELVVTGAPGHPAGPLPHTAAASATGTGELEVTAEASEVTWELWTLAANLPTSKRTFARYVWPDGTTQKTVDQNFEERISPAGLSEVFVRIIEADGTITPMVGVCRDNAG